MDEVSIPVPWGHIAAKWWGRKSIRPIVCLHGWQDNAGSFDSLILMLPNHLSYLAVDLPGHGLSSRLPDGMMYSLKDYFYCLVLICEHFRWDKVSLMSHSLGSVVNFLYAATFPDKCDMVIGFESLRPYDVNPYVVYQDYSININQLLKADIRNRNQTEPPCYEYEDLFKKIGTGLFMEIFESAAPYLLQRGVKQSKNHPNKYFFARDGRLTALAIPMIPNQVTLVFAEHITAPYCFIKASRGPIDEESFKDVLETMQRIPHFEMHNVDGDHHVHLNEPHKVSGIISTFINKIRPATVVSKL